MTSISRQDTSRANIQLSLIVISVIALWITTGCLGDEGARSNGGTVDAEVVENTTGVPLHDVTRRELAENEDVLRAVEEALVNGTGGHRLSEDEVEAAGRFLSDYESYKPDRHRDDQPVGTYFVYRNRSVAVWVTSLE